MLNALTVDVEDYFQVSAFAPYLAQADWDRFPSRVAGNTQRLLEMLARREVRATFFVLGWIARRLPRLVEEIRAAGHEIGSHGYAHQLIYRMSPDEFRADLVRARAALEDASGGPVRSFRAPSFSITRKSLWALEILAEEGIRYDSSIFPVYHDRYGIPGANPAIHCISTPSGPLWEFPPSVARIGPVNLPVSGGGYFRLYPLGLSLRLLRRVNRRHRRPFVFYVHPWEIDPQQPRVPFGSRLTRFRHYLNLASTEKKLDGLLGAFRFAPLGEVVEQVRTEAGAA